MNKLLKDISKENITLTKSGNGIISYEAIIASALIRIAESSELLAETSKVIASNHAQLIKDRDYYKTAYQGKKLELETMERTNRGLKGHITRLKNK